MDLPEIRAGDQFALTNDEAAQEFIRFGCGVLSLDGFADFGHCGTITDHHGGTYEVRWGEGYGYGNLSNYIGCRILIVRHKDMTTEAFQKGMAAVLPYKGLPYPKLRFLPFCFPLLPKYIHPFNRPVCSELMFMHGAAAGLKRMTYWWGVTPDRAAECLDAWRENTIIYKGVLK